MFGEYFDYIRWHSLDVHSSENVASEVDDDNVRCVLSGKDREELKGVRMNLQQTPNDLFERLAEDVYDEVHTGNFKVL